MPELLAGTAQTPQAPLPVPGRPAPAWRDARERRAGPDCKAGTPGRHLQGPGQRDARKGPDPGAVSAAGAVGLTAGLAGVAGRAAAPAAGPQAGRAVVCSQLARGSRRDCGPRVSVGSSETGVRTREASAVCGRRCPRSPLPRAPPRAAA